MGGVGATANSNYLLILLNHSTNAYCISETLTTPEPRIITNTHTDLSFISSFCVMLKSGQDIRHQSCVSLSLHKHDKPNRPWLHMVYSLGPDFTALLNIFSHQIALSDGCGLEMLHPPPPRISWDSGWRNVAGFGRRQACSSTASSLPTIPACSPSHAPLIPGIYRGDMSASALTPLTPYAVM